MLKRRLLEWPNVPLSDVKRNFILEMDASSVAIGAVLEQQLTDTHLEHSVRSFSFEPNQSEQNYCAYELEMFAVVKAVKNYRIYLLGKYLLLWTYHMALVRMLQATCRLLRVLSSGFDASRNISLELNSKKQGNRFS